MALAGASGKGRAPVSAGRNSKSQAKVSPGAIPTIAANFGKSGV
jgi:hypothetical protein